MLVHAPVPDRLLTKVNELVRELKKEGAMTADEVPGRSFGAAATRSPNANQLTAPPQREETFHFHSSSMQR